MSNMASTITSKWQITIPEQVRRELPFKVGQRIAWEVQGDTLVGRRIRTIKELAGSLKSRPGKAEDKKPKAQFAQAALARHDRISKQKA